MVLLSPAFAVQRVLLGAKDNVADEPDGQKNSGGDRESPVDKEDRDNATERDQNILYKAR